MTPEDVVTGLSDPAPCLVCEDLTHRESKARYRVPLRHRVLTECCCKANVEEARRLIAALPDLASVRQLKALLRGEQGLGLWVSAWVDDRRGSFERETELWQAGWGSIVVYPPHEWPCLMKTWEDWFFQGVEKEFADVPYSFADVLPFAGPNFSPDRWFLVLRGPMAGKVFWWTHDGDWVMDTPWAEDIRGWADRIWQETPDVFGGVIRFRAEESIDHPPEDAELYPLHYDAGGAASKA